MRPGGRGCRFSGLTCCRSLGIVWSHSAGEERKAEMSTEAGTCIGDVVRETLKFDGQKRIEEALASDPLLGRVLSGFPDNPRMLA